MVDITHFSDTKDPWQYDKYYSLIISKVDKLFGLQEPQICHKSSYITYFKICLLYRTSISKTHQIIDNSEICVKRNTGFVQMWGFFQLCNVVTI